MVSMLMECMLSSKYLFFNFSLLISILGLGVEEINKISREGTLRGQQFLLFLYTGAVQVDNNGIFELTLSFKIFINILPSFICSLYIPLLALLKTEVTVVVLVVSITSFHNECSCVKGEISWKHGSDIHGVEFY